MRNLFLVCLLCLFTCTHGVDPADEQYVIAILSLGGDISQVGRGEYWNFTKSQLQSRIGKSVTLKASLEQLRNCRPGVTDSYAKQLNRLSFRLNSTLIFLVSS